MKKKIEQIIKLLSEIENDIADEQDQQFIKNFDALELPSIISSVVEFLHPLLKPYEIAVYWYLFNESIVKTGQQYTRASTRGMSTIATSASGQSTELSYGIIKRTLHELCEKGVVKIDGAPNREGTLYKVFIPDEISICKELMQKHVDKEKSVINTEKELDFYNVKENRLKIFERDGYKCHYCHKQLTRFSATLDHIQPVSEGGDNSYDNLVTSCLLCNSSRGSKPYMDFVTKDS